MKHTVRYLFALTLLMVFVPLSNAQSSCSPSGSGAEVYLSVPNFTDQTLNVYWIDSQCNEQLIDIIQPNQVFYQTTYDGHEWVFRDDSGQVVQQFTASTGSPLVVIGTAYNPVPVTSNCSSADTRENTDLRVINNTNEPVLLFWIAFDCSEVLYNLVEGQDEYLQGTFVGHDWVVRFTDGLVAKQTTIVAGDNTIVIDPPAGSTVNTGSAPTADYPVTESGCDVAPVTPDMELDAFYTKFCDYKGLVITSSDNVADAALEQAWLVAANVLYTRDDVVESLVEMGFRIVIMSEDEVTTDVPELAYLANEIDTNYDEMRSYDKVLEEPRLVATAEENLLCAADDVNRGQNLLVGSLGNLTRFALVMELDPEIRDTVETARQNALTNGIWSPSPWITENNGSYWNYGVQTYFNSSFDALLTGPTDDFTNTRSELESYDPELYNLIDAVYNTDEWTPACPTTDADETVSTESTPVATAAIEPTPDTTVTTDPTPDTTTAAFPVTESGCEVAPVTPDMGFDPFYAKYCTFNGLIITSSDQVEDAALEQAWLIAANMLYTRPDVAESLAGMNFRIVVIAQGEKNTDVPELAYLATDDNTENDSHRGYDKVLEEPRISTIAEENLLCANNDVYRGESRWVRSLGNLTRFALVMDLDPSVGDKVAAARENAIANGLWSEDITGSNGAYWDNGVQIYFNGMAILTGPKDPKINTRAELATYDPELHDLIDSIFNAEEWTPACPS